MVKILRSSVMVLAALLIVSACGSDNESAAPGRDAASSTVPTSGGEPSWDMVVISDSALGDGTNAGTNRAVPEALARAIESDLGVEVQIELFYYGGEASQVVLDEIRTNDTMRSAVRAAEMIVLWVPYGELKTLCPWNGAAYRPGPGTPQTYQACGAAMAERLGADSDAIFSELVSLHGPGGAAVRVLNYWVPFVPTFAEMGLLSAASANFDAFNAALAAGAARHELDVVDLHAALMGPDGSDDPVASGLVQSSDELHLTEDGVNVVVQALRDLGFEPHR